MNDEDEMGFAGAEGFVSDHMFDTIETDRPLTHDLFGKITRLWPVIYADPPWAFENRSELGEDRNANRHYDTMNLEDIMRMPVRDIAAKDAILFMWVTDPTLAQAMHVIEAWGFEYKTVGFYWTKTWEHTDHEAMHQTKDFPIGTGYITRGNPEQLWVAARGEPRRRLHLIDGIMKPDMSIRRQQFAPRREHSQKPDKFYGLIERLYDGPYLELFARTRRPGWSSWGNQVGAIEEGLVGRKRKGAKREPAPTPLFGEEGGNGDGEPS